MVKFKEAEEIKNVVSVAISQSNWHYPVLQYEESLAFSDEEKDNMMVKVLTK